MIDVEAYMQSIVEALQKCFDSKLLCVGLQGSYLRGEATESSDIDIVVILDELAPKDLAAYKEIVSGLASPEKSCGFICGKSEMENWNPLEVCNFLYGTKDYYGELARFLPAYTDTDIANFIKLSLGNLYHEITHRYVHATPEKNKSKLPYAYKNVFFILQSLYCLRTGTFYPTKKELISHLSDGDREMLERAARLSSGDLDFDFEEAFSALLGWCQETLRSLPWNNHR